MKKMTSKNKGFTLMEIIFVILLIALIVNFALPAFRAVLYDVKNSRAKTALKKLAEARISFFKTTRGYDIQPTNGVAYPPFTGEDAKEWAAEPCEGNENPVATGIPSNSTSLKPVSILFQCGFLDWRDFENLPYYFYICNLNNATPEEPCSDRNIYAGAIGTDKAGKKYKEHTGEKRYFMRVYKTHDKQQFINTVVDTEDIPPGA